MEQQEIYLDQVPKTETEWLWEPYIPRGKITIVQGDPGEGKTTLMLQIAAAVTNGLNFPENNEIVNGPALVLYQNAEDGYSDTIVPRLDAARADKSMIFFLNECALELTSQELADAIDEKKPKLVILDPLQAFLGSNVDMHRANEIRPVMSYLASLANRSGAAVVLIGHMNKMQGSKAIYRGLGSIDLTASARSVLLVARDPAKPENRVVLQIKNSLAEMAKPAAFTLHDGKFEWLGEYDITPERLLNGAASPVRESAAEKAEKFLLELFAEVPTDLPQNRVMEQAAAAGIYRTALMNAKKQLGIRSIHQKNCWVWTNRMYDSVGESEQ